MRLGRFPLRASCAPSFAFPLRVTLCTACFVFVSCFAHPVPVFLSILSVLVVPCVASLFPFALFLLFLLPRCLACLVYVSRLAFLCARACFVLRFRVSPCLLCFGSCRLCVLSRLSSRLCVWSCLNFVFLCNLFGLRYSVSLVCSVCCVCSVCLEVALLYESPRRKPG